MKTRTVQTVITKYVDKESGELLDVEKKETTIVAKDQESFFLTYSTILAVYKNLNGSTIKVLTWLLMNVVFETGLVVINDEIRSMISTAMGIKNTTVNTCIKPLVDNEILLKTKTKGMYHINPVYFWKGRISERKAKLNYLLNIQFNLENEELL